jgi:hypothetical protein
MIDDSAARLISGQAILNLGRIALTEAPGAP